MEQHQAGSKLRAEVERQLLKDLEHYGLESEGLSFDWSHICPEGHGTWYLGDRLDGVSGLNILDKNSDVVANGWIEFVHGGEDNPLFVFWEFLRINVPGIPREAKIKKGIPEHIWNQLPDKSKDLCMKREAYDAMWCDDPRVVQRQGTKTLQELEGKDWGEPNQNTNLVTKCHDLRRVPLKNLTVENLRLMIGQQIGLSYLVPVALDILQIDPLAQGDMYPGDLLISVHRLPEQYWITNFKLKFKFKKIVEQTVAQIDALDNDISSGLVKLKQELQRE